MNGRFKLVIENGFFLEWHWIPIMRKVFHFSILNGTFPVFWSKSYFSKFYSAAHESFSFPCPWICFHIFGGHSHILKPGLMYTSDNYFSSLSLIMTSANLYMTFLLLYFSHLVYVIWIIIFPIRNSKGNTLFQTLLSFQRPYQLVPLLKLECVMPLNGAYAWHPLSHNQH